MQHRSQQSSFFLLFFLAGIAVLIAAEPNPPVDIAIIRGDASKSSRDVNITISIEKTSIPIKLDGVLDDDVWKKTTFFDFLGVKNDKATRSQFAVVRNQYGIYFAVECFEPDMGKLNSNCDVRDGLFEFFRRDDWVEILIAPLDSGCDYYWFLFNPSGMQTDSCAHADPDLSWNGIWEVATGHAKNSWTSEIFIPFKTFNRGPIGDKWRFQVARLRVNDNKKYKPEKTEFSRSVWKGEYRMPGTWPSLTGMKTDPKLFAFKITQPVIVHDENKETAKIVSTITNKTGKEIKVKPVYEIMQPGLARGLIPHGNGPILAMRLDEVILQPEQTQELSSPIQILPSQVAIVSLAIFDKQNNLVAYSRDKGIRLESVIEGPGPRLSLYTSQDEADLKFNLRKWTEKATLKICLAGTEKIVPASSPIVETSVKINTLMPGKYKIDVTLFEDGKVLGRREFELYKFAPAKGSVACTDRWSRCIVFDGTPFVAFGGSPCPGFDLNYIKNTLYDMAQNGFNTIHLWEEFLDQKSLKSNIAKIDFARIEACFDYAEKNNLKVILSLGHIMQNEPSSPFYKFKLTDAQRLLLIKTLVKFLSNKKQLLGYEVVDEPEYFISPDWAEKMYRQIKEADPYHLAMINNCRGARSTLTYQNASDTLGIDYYPIGKWPASTVGPLTSEVVEFAQYKPVKMWIQGYKIFNPRAPSPEELEMMTWSMFARGASSFFYFIGIPEPPLWKAQGECAKEITSLTQAAASCSREVLNINPATAGIYASFRLTTDVSWIIAVNEQPKPSDVEVLLPSQIKSSEAEVIFENRKLEIKNGKIKDHFAPLQRHVYKIIELKQ